MTAVHYLIRHREQYAQYAALSAESLIRRGRVPHNQIIASVVGDAVNFREIAALESLGVEVLRLPVTPAAKYVFVDRIFRDRPELTQIIQLDCDTVLTEDTNFLEHYAAFPHDLGAYELAVDGKDLLDRRSELFIPGWKYSNSPFERERFDALIRAGVGTNLHAVRERITSWVWGSLISIRREVLRSPAWNTMLALSWVGYCDEVMLQVVRPYVDFALIPQTLLPHRTNPPVLDLDDGPGTLHFAGNWYRVDIEENRNKLTNRFNQLFSTVCG